MEYLVNNNYQYKIYWNKPGVTVTFSNGHDQLPLTYAIYDHPPAVKFLHMLQKSIKKSLIQETSFVIDTKNELDLMTEIVHITNKLNLDINLGVEELHKIVERVQAPNEDWDKLNRLIHTYEQYKSNQESPRMNAFFRFDNAETMPIENEDLLFFRMDRSYGDLCMGYNTLGKHWLEIAGRNEVDRINDVKTQQHLNCEGYMLFRSGYDTPFTVSKHFVEWYKKNVNKNITLEMALGYIVVGKLVMPLDWNNTYHNERDQWTRTLSEYKTIVKVELTQIEENTTDLMKKAKMI